MLERATPTEFLEAPIGRYVRGPTYLVWCVDRSLCGAAYWGRPSASDARAAVRLFGIDGHADMKAPFDVVTDARRVRAIDGAAFAVLAGHLRQKSADYAARIRRHAVVHPDGLLGAAIAGLYSVVAPAHSWRPFVALDAALAWIDRSDAAPLADALGQLTREPSAPLEPAPRSPRAISLAPPDSVRQRAEERIGASLCDRYRLTRLLGVGGMGAVYAGEHRNGHLVAVKILHERLAGRPDLEHRVRREALLANRVKHPAIVPVLDDDVTDDGCVFLVMPLLVGETVRARWERHGRRLPIEEVALIGHRMLDALAAAHRALVVHRDVKPENVFLTRGGELRLLDFGVARLLESADPLSATMSGHAIGTPAFMAPEQALGRVRAVDARTDVWGVGATMYALASGRLVHEGATVSEILVSAATRPARALRDVAPHAPPRLAAVVNRALAFGKAARWGSAEAMQEALGAAIARDLGATVASLQIDVPASPVEAPPAPIDARCDTWPTDVNAASDALRGATTRTLRLSTLDARAARLARGRRAIALAVMMLLVALLSAGFALVAARRRAAR